MSKSDAPVSDRPGGVICELNGIWVIFKDVTVSDGYREKEVTWKSL